MKLRKALSGLLALLTLTALVVPAMASPNADAESLTPEGNMTLVDDIDGGAAGDKQFIVVQSRNGHCFYIIIDHASEGENTVHFLNQVDEADLLALIEEGPVESAPPVCTCTTKCIVGAVNTSCEVCAVNMRECIGTEPEPETSEEPNPSDKPDSPKEPAEPGGVNPLVVLAVLAALGTGIAVAYPILAKKRSGVKKGADLDDYDDSDDDQDDDSEDDEPEDDDLEEMEDE